jgi:E3 ubiquitin-protein ligase UBR7
VADNKYNQNFKNRFCGCECDYDAYKEKGTMFQCLGLGTVETGGCGEDWWHPGCVVGLGPNWFESTNQTVITRKPKTDGLPQSITEAAENIIDGGAVLDAQNGSDNLVDRVAEEAEDEDPPLPPGFPDEDDFEGFICYKCVDAHPWIKKYAGAPGFLAPVFRRSAAPSPEIGLLGKVEDVVSPLILNAKKRKADDEEGSESSGPSKRVKDESADQLASSTAADPASTPAPEVAAKSAEDCKTKVLPPAPTGQISLFFKPDFRDHLCRCSDCFPLLKPHSQLLEEETIYEPSMSGSDDDAEGSTVGSGSLYDRGESALKNVDRVRAIEGVMAYNHLKDKLKPFFQQFAESGKAISAEDIKAHFAKMRGDEQAIREAGEGAKNADNRKEQSGY